MPQPPSEFALIDAIRRQVAVDARVPLGIGDDAAVLATPSGDRLLVAVDTVLEGTHFTFPEASAADVGRKALAVNLSDIAAMGGRPVAAFVALSVPRKRPSVAADVMDGLCALARDYDVVVAGGDTTSWHGPLAISVTVTGELLGEQPVTRGGARAGDILLVTGALGGSLAGSHLSFTPRVREIASILKIAVPTAMIDISDGLAADLWHILDESAVGAIVEGASIPRRACADGTLVSLEASLGDGEDFELLMTFAPEDAQRLLEQWRGECPITRIGTMTAERVAWLSDESGGRTALERRGYSHDV